MDQITAQIIERLGSFGLVAVVLVYFLVKYERLFQHLEKALTANAVRLARIEVKLGIDNERRERET